MKKLFLIGLVVFALPLFVFADDKSPTLSYTVEEDASFEWSVPASVTVSSEVTTNNMQRKPGHSATIAVTASNVVLPASKQLVIYYPAAMRHLVNGTSSIPYYINEGEGDAASWTGALATIMENNRLALRAWESTNSKTSNLTVTVYESDIANATAIGEHTDTITFTAEVIAND
jgi:hypothetical protein